MGLGRRVTDWLDPRVERAFARLEICPEPNCRHREQADGCDCTDPHCVCNPDNR